MKRRDFLQSSIGAGLAAGAALSAFNLSNLFAAGTYKPGEAFDLVAVKGGEPGEMFDLGIQSLGGIGNFVKQGQKVLVKPNIGWDTVPERAADTNPQLVGRIVEQCYIAGASEVNVFDYTCDEWRNCYKNSGIEKTVKDAGGNMLPGNTENYYRQVDIPEAKQLKTEKVHELVLDSDVFINVPVLKHHGSAQLSIAMKNLMGVIWNRRYWHRNNLHQCIADYALYPKRPTLNIVDAYRIMMKNGPRGVSVDDVIMPKSLLISTDIVAIDAAATKIFGEEPENIPYIRIADEMGVGTMDLSTLNIDRIKI